MTARFTSLASILAIMLAACAVMVLGAAGCGPAAAQPTAGAATASTQAATWQALSGQLEALRAKHGLTALIVGVGIGDAPPLVAAAGTSITGVPARTDMHFRIGAMAIAAQTTMLLQLVDEGRVKLDDTIDKWLPTYPAADKVTLRMLADSTSGYADYEADAGFVKAFENDVFYSWSTEQLLKVAFAHDLAFAPDTGFLYSHTNFIVLGQALAAATGTPYETLLQQRILDKLGLRQTKTWTTAELPEPALHGFTSERGVFEDSTFWSPSWTSSTGRLNGDISDTARMIRALATGATLSKESLKLMLTPATIGKGGNTPDRAFSLGMELLAPWVQKAFFFGGYGGVAAYRAVDDLTIVVVATPGRATDPNNNPAGPIFQEITAMFGR